MITFRDLTPNEIDCRIAQISEKGLSLLLYKDARCDMNILDETVGAENWQREHYDCKGNLFCRVGINVNYDKSKEEPRWVWKSDCGAESNTEKQKGEASDSFKRAGFNWGIGRELYTAPFIWIAPNNFTTKQKDKKTVCYNKFIVTHIKIENKKITELVIVNQDLNREVFNMMTPKQPEETPEQLMTKYATILAQNTDLTPEQIISQTQTHIVNAYSKKGKTLSQEQIKNLTVKKLLEKVKKANG